MTVQVVCEREFTTVIDGEVRPIVVRWMQPRPDQNDWRCEYTITWPVGPERRSCAMGADSAQALILAFHSVSSELEAAPWPVRWFDGAVNDLGLPTHSNLSTDASGMITTHPPVAARG